MSIQRFGILLFGVLFLFCAGTAAAEPQMHLQADTAWLVAGSGGTSTVMVTVTDSGGAPLAGQSVAFSCDPALGTVSPSTVTTGADGKTTATFRAGTRSGPATITATFEYLDEDDVPRTVSSSCDQMIDHAAPYRLAVLEYESEITVGSTTAIVLAMEDRYGNRVDARREAETVRFQVGSPGGRAGISDGSEYRDDVVLPVDENGDVTADFRADQTAGENIIYVSFPGTVAATTLTIYGIGNAAPASIACSVNPYSDPVPWVPADGESTFTLTYTLKDASGNPAGNRSVLFSALAGEDRSAVTNSDGQVMISYGPKDATGTVTITATSADDPSVVCSQTVEFTNTEPVNMLLSANPQSMPSRDVKDDMAAEIRAKVMDEKGNPVFGETVTFSLSNIDTAGYSATASPELVEMSATTDGDGYAVVHFRPGAFTRDRNDPAYSNTATGTCEVVAVWGDVSRTLPLTWKNYPYLSVSTSVDPETVEVNGTVNVTLALKGDGWALQPDPIDVVLAIDRSGSMLYDNPDRMHSVREAAKQFVGSMSSDRDRVAVVSFGRNGSISRPGSNSRISTSYINNNYVCPVTYSDYATVDSDLSSDAAAVDTTLDSLVPDHGTPMRHGLYKSVSELVSDGRDDAVKAIVLLSDGDYNWYGDPLARGYQGSSTPTYYNDLDSRYYYYSGLSHAEQNMATYALDHDIKIYSIGYADSISSGGRSTLRTLAETTGGKYYDGDAANIDDVYSQIAGDLKTEAGVDTMMDLSFQNVQVNNAPVPGEDVFAYQYIPGVSTNIASWIDNETGHYDPVPLHTEDQTADWEDDQSLHFDIGTVRLGQTWTTSYTLKVLKDGNINVFGPGSTISFNGGTDSLDLPETFITAVPDLNNTGIMNATLDLVEPLQRVGSGPVTDFLKVGWHMNYTGNYTATQRLSYSTDRGKTWTPFLTMTPRPAGERDEVASLDIRSLAAGRYLIRVDATAPDTRSDRVQLINGIQVGNLQSNKIRLE
ncbi:MAG: Ig-like domain-containing protein [Methanofollis sp.]|uniref:Ig-like domain-containing protein n=1 Tax=Methanofollis sp. TaxID=2052835 RepID=UPI002638BE10|nr:Ig-like domain-containing protein [Methanofollis sp.]MDD4255656.1 Ig-like domain-containing protein [Methanofollis sp.]